MKKLYIFGVIIIGIGVGIYFITRGADPPLDTTKITSAKPGQSPGPIVAEIQMKEDGYEPASVKLRPGEAVRFINASQGERWPASNIHPTHELYPEFDPKNAIKPAESWTFTFHKAGSWRLHDHLYPYMKGIIAVSN